MAKRRDRSGLILGTVQFGTDYGIANRTGKPPPDEVQRVLSAAAAEGIQLLDTAPAYGNAEDLIGAFADPGRLDIVTKVLPPAAGNGPADPASCVEESIRCSLRRLRRERVDSVLVHDAARLLAPGGEELWKALVEARNSGFMRRLGVSVYDPQLLRRLLDCFEIEIVQLPFNVFDNRFARTGLIEEAARRGISVHARSPFLQGLLLMNPKNFPCWLTPLQEHHARFRQWTAEWGQGVLALALAACRAQAGIEAVVAGCQSLREFQQIVSEYDRAGELPEAGSEAVERFALPEEPLINPLHWPQ